MSSVPSQNPPNRGELRIYLGAAPGVGKTYAMLGEARRRKSRGCDVVIGVVETHGRQHTAELLDGLEVIARRDVTHRGVELSELDVQAVLARRPEVVLIDELAHTNAPGSRNPKRWQDVEQLLDAGIDVLSTVNVQHLESLNDVVQDITGVVQQETVPDEVVRRAEQVELVDITPEALRRRLSHGNVYRPEQIDAAMGNYFRPGNLTALREIALLWVADQVDTALAKYRTDHAITNTWEARERTVVSVTGGPESETLIRRAKRIATRVGGELVVVHVVRGDGVAGVSPTSLRRIRTLAEGMGATVHNIVGDNVPGALLEFARGINATQLVLGTSRRSRWARVFDEGVAATVIRDSGAIDVHLVTHDEAAAGRNRPANGSSIRRRMLSWVSAVAAPSLATLALLGVGQFADLNSQGVLYFVVVVGVALFGGVGPAVLAAVLSGGLLNFFFTEPRFSLAIAQPDNLITLVVLMLVAVAVAMLVDVAARRARDATLATREAELLTLFASHVLRGTDLPALLDRLRETYGQQAAGLLRDEAGVLRSVASVGTEPPPSPETADTSTEIEDGQFVLVLRGPPLTARDRRVLRAVTYQAVGLLRQSELAVQAEGARALAEGDRLRRALLSAVSHDLRTPLASIKAGVSALRSVDVEFSAADTAELLAGVEVGADQLTALVDNLLDSSRLAAGVVHPRTEAVYCEEVVSRALAGLHAGGRVVISTPSDEPDELLPAVLADPGLLERVLANLLANALRYAPEGPIRVSAAERDGRVRIRISDSGPGLSRDALGHLFEPFQRLGDRDTSTGVGLGLTVVKGFTEAMGGTVTAEDTAGGGLTMVVELPSAASVPAAA